MAFFIFVGMSDPLAVESHRYICFIPFAITNRDPEGDWAACTILGLTGLQVISSREIENDIGYSFARNAVRITVWLKLS
jgi:hypothetical protein